MWSLVYLFPVYWQIYQKPSLHMLFQGKPLTRNDIFLSGVYSLVKVYQLISRCFSHCATLWLQDNLTFLHMDIVHMVLSLPKVLPMARPFLLSFYTLEIFGFEINQKVNMVIKGQ